VRPSPDYRRLLRPSPGSFFVVGLAGAGKTTWACAHFPDSHLIDLRDDGVCQRFLAEPSALAAEIGPLPRQPVIFSEVQRAPALLAEVDRLITGGDRRFVLLASSARSIRAAAAPLLDHGVAEHALYPLVPEELGRDYTLDRVLRFGSLPAVWEAADPWATLETWMQTYVRDEIRADAVVRNVPAFLRFLPAAALAHGRVVNTAALARDAAASRTTIAGYVRILQDTLLATLLPAFETRLRVRERRHPKLYWTDAGLMRAAKRQLGEVTAEERDVLLEGFVLTVLRAHNAREELFEDIGYWAPAQARLTEVDFLLRRGRDYLAIDVKAQPRHDRMQLAGLRAIDGLPRLVRRVLIYLGEESLRDDGIEVWPVRDWLAAVAGGRLWP
jgi:predicted AAA+ superfamily ATPase